MKKKLQTQMKRTERNQGGGLMTKVFSQRLKYTIEYSPSLKVYTIRLFRALKKTSHEFFNTSK